MRQRWSVVAIVGLASIPLVLLALAILWDAHGKAQQRVIEDREALARATALSVQAFIEGNLAAARTLAAVPSLTDPGDPSAQRHFQEAIAANPEWQGLALVDATGGTLVSASVGPNPPLNIADRPYFQEAMRTGKPTVSPAVIGRATGKPAVVLAVPADIAGHGRGILIVPLPLARLGQALDAPLVPAHARVVVVDRDGQTIVHSDPERVSALAPLGERPDVRAALAGASDVQQLTIDGERRLSAYAPVALGGAVMVSEPVSYAFADARRLLLEGLALIVAALGTAGVTAWVLGGRVQQAYQRQEAAWQEAARGRGAAEAASARAWFLSEATRRLEEALGRDATLTAAAELAVPLLGDMCIVDVVEQDGRIRRLTGVHADPERGQAMQRMLSYAPRPDGVRGAALVMRTGQPQFVQETTDETRRALAQDEEHLALLRQVDTRSIMVLPLRTRDRIVGAITFGAGEERARYTDDDLKFAEDFASRVALAVDNARLYADLEQALTARDEFLASASHDMRTPLTAVIGNAHLLRRYVDRGNLDPGRFAEVLTSIEQAGRRINGLVGAMLDISRLQFGEQLRLERAPADLVSLVREVVSEMGDEAHPIEVAAPAALPGNWDRTRLERVVRNLVENALKYSPEGSRVRVAVEQAAEAEPVAVLRVQDWGIGIPAAEQPGIFERFRRGSNVVGRFDGVGLGLAGARQVVEQHGGTIAVASEEGRGTTFTVRLPLAMEVDAPGAVAPDEADATPALPR